MITYHYRNIRDSKLTRLDKFRTGSWVRVEAPTETELNLLATKFNLDPDLLTDALDPDEIPRLEIDDDNTYVYMRYALRQGEQVITRPVLLVVGPKFVASISPAELPETERLLASSLITTQRAKLLLQLLRHIIGTYERNITYLTRQIRSVRARLNVATINNRDFVQFVVIEDALNYFLSELVPANLLLSSLLSGRHGLTFFEDDRDLIEDLIQATRQLTETSSGALKTIVNIREAYSNIMTNNLNRQVQLLTSLTVVLTIPTIVFSLYGMNVPLPGQGSHAAFGWIMLGTLAVCSLILYVLYRRRWL
ncbi:MAG TPA: magnesium transporter CorA family protein [Candidatus Saccharimonadia bacterium]|nr:magnesium transporter CorA family protein [Candidatus Saccharimonadia bacterium]